MNTARLTIRTILLLAVTHLLAACGGPYMIQGKVVAGSFSAIDFVDPDDPRLEDRGVSSAEVRLYRDPGKPNMALTGRALSGADGALTLYLDAFGAGWLEEVWRITVTRSGYGTSETILPLPSARKNRRLLIILAPGPSRPPEGGEDLMDMYEKYR